MVLVSIETIGAERFIRGFNRIAVEAADLTVPFNTIYRNFLEIEKNIFDKEGDPVKFKRLTTRYRRWKEKKYPGRKIMHLSGALERALTEGDIKKIERTSAEFGTDIVYAHRHQEGTFGMPQRKIVQLTNDHKVLWSKIIHEWIIKVANRNIENSATDDGNYNGADLFGPKGE